MPMVWTACEREDFVPEVQAMRRRVEELVPAEVRARELKLGTGGLRDVEFAVQLLQLVHGRNDESLHVASTVDALAALGAGGYIGRDDAANMTASYEFLRLLEHRLQLQRLKRTHMLPESRRRRGDALAGARGPHAARRSARRARGAARGAQAAEPCGCRGCTPSCSISRCWNRLANRAGISDGMTPEAAERQLAALGYEGPQSALTHLAALTGRQRQARPGAAGAAADAAGLAVRHPRSGRRAAGVPPDQRGAGRPAVVPVDAARRRRGGQAADAGAGHLGVRARAADAGTGGDPAVRGRARTGRSCSTSSPTAVARALVASAGRHADPVRAIAAARTLRRRELARIASADLLGMLEVTDVCKALTSVWVAVLQAALEAVIRANTPDGGAPARIAVIGMGRLGGGELGYGSDADVMFVCEPERRRRRIRRGALVGDASPSRCARCWARRAPTRRWRSTPVCGRRAATARWCARLPRMRRTTRSGRSRGRSRRCCGRTGWRATRTSASGSC